MSTSDTYTKTRASSRTETEEVKARGAPQEQPSMKVEPLKEHDWLRRLVGEWVYEGEMTMEPDKPPVKFKGEESVRSIGDLWILAEGRGEMPDGCPGTTVMTLGYDPGKKRFAGTFIASMMPHLWLYDGSLDASEKLLTLNTEGPMTLAGKTVTAKDVIQIESDDHRVFTSYILGDDGTWRQVMRAHNRRQK